MTPRRFSVLAIAALVACGGDRSTPRSDSTAASAASPPREVHFSARDFAFDGPDTIQGGLVTLVLTNESETWHHLQLIRLPDGMSPADFQAAMSQMQPGAPPPPWMGWAGGVNPPPQGVPARNMMNLEPGQYMVLCFVDTPDHVPHVMKGMAKPLTVTAGADGALPAADLNLTLVDYAFSFSEPPTAGSHVIRVHNQAAQAHEIAVFKILPGKTMDDVMAWGATYEGPAPMTPVGGVPGIAPGQTVDVDLGFTPGSYVALCFLPDATDGKLHMEHGMVLPFTIS